MVKPIIVGFHGLGTTFKTNTCQLVESQGAPMSPASLYEAQLEARLKTLPTWIDKAQSGYDFYEAWVLGSWRLKNGKKSLLADADRCARLAADKKENNHVI